MSHVVNLDEVIKERGPDARMEPWKENNPWPFHNNNE